MKRGDEAHWVKDGAFVTLRVGGRIRAQADTEFNVGMINEPGSIFRKSRLAPVFGDSGEGIIQSIERKLGLREVRVLDKSGDELPWVRAELANRARQFQEWTVRSPHNPVVEAEQALGNAHEALSRALRAGSLDAPARQAMEACAMALEELHQGRFSSAGREATLLAASALARSTIDKSSPRHGFYIREAKDACRHAAALAGLYGERADPELQGGNLEAKPEKAEQEVRIARVMIVRGDPASDLRLEGRLARSPDVTFSAKLSEAGGKEGLHGSRIEKLELRRKEEIVASYDGGWQHAPSSWKDKAALRDIVASFPRIEYGQGGLLRKGGFRPGSQGL